jgi:hypothetical protein
VSKQKGKSVKNVKEFSEKGYTIIRGALSKEVTDLATQYTLFDEMQDFAADVSQVLGAHAKYADPLVESLLAQLQNLVESNTGVEVYPTYSFYRVYRPGQELVPHKDRKECEISVTACLGYDYAGADYSWPIFIEGTPVDMAPGDIICYRGIELEHWREKFSAPDGAWHSQAFLHYVDVNGPYADAKYDGRESIGVTHPNFLKGFQNKSRKELALDQGRPQSVFLPSLENKPRYLDFS